MNNKDQFKKAGFSVINSESSENKLLDFLKENYPSVIMDNEIDLNELKAIVGLPIDNKVNGYRLNFVGRNVARAKYKQETEKELKLNTELSKNLDTTQNLVLKGDNLDSLKILKNHYMGKIKCIYIDPPYNTVNDEFVYRDKFDQEEAEVLGLANLSEADIKRLEFSFGSKKSHNGWLSFMYPRLLLAKDLLSKDGVIFISIDDNEQANLKLLCDEIFGEENFLSLMVIITGANQSGEGVRIQKNTEYCLAYSKTINSKCINRVDKVEESYRNLNDAPTPFETRKDMGYSIYYNPITKELIPLHDYDKERISTNDANQVYTDDTSLINRGFIPIRPGMRNNKLHRWRWNIDTFKNRIDEIVVFENDGEYQVKFKQKGLNPPKSYHNYGGGTSEVKNLFDGIKLFDYPKGLDYIKYLASIGCKDDEIILDFFAGSGTTRHAIMQLNAEDGGNRKFILCQIDDPLEKNKPAYKFCKDNNLPTVISSITIERLNRAGKNIAKEIEEENKKKGMFNESKKPVPDIGYKVFDSVMAPKLMLEDKQITIDNVCTDSLSRIYNMIFSVGIDEPTQTPEVIAENSIYKIGENYYITNSENI